MIHGCEQVFGHNPLRLKWISMTPRKVGDTVAAAGSAAVLAALSVVPLGLRGPVRRAADCDRCAGGADRQGAQARRPEFRRAHRGCLCLREPARAAARDAGRRLAGRQLRQADCRGLAVGDRSHRNRAVGEGISRVVAVGCRSGGKRAPRPLRQHRSHRRGRCAVRQSAGAQRCLASVVARDHRWRRSPDPARQCGLPRRRGAARKAHGAASRSSRCAAHGRELREKLSGP